MIGRLSFDSDRSISDLKWLTNGTVNKPLEEVIFQLEGLIEENICDENC